MDLAAPVEDIESEEMVLSDLLQRYNQAIQLGQPTRAELEPLYIPDLILSSTPEQNVHGRLLHRALQADPRGLLVVLQVPDTLHAGDCLAVFADADDKPLLMRTLLEHDIGANVALYLPVDALGTGIRSLQVKQLTPVPVLLSAPVRVQVETNRKGGTMGQVIAPAPVQVEHLEDARLAPIHDRVAVTIDGHELTYSARVTLRWSGIGGSGLPVFYQVARSVTRNAVGQPMTFQVDGMAYLLPLAGGNLQIGYTIQHRGELDPMDAVPLDLRVDPEQLNKPVVAQAIGEVLMPDSLLSGLTVQTAQYRWASPGDEIELRCEVPGMQPWVESVFLTTADDPWPLTFNVPYEALRDCAGKRVTICETLYRVNGVESPLPVRELTVLPISMEYLPRIYVAPPRTQGELNLASYEDDAVVYMSANSWLLEGRAYWVEVYGSRPDGSAAQLTLATGKVDARIIHSGLEVVCPRAFFEQCTDRSTITFVVRLRANDDSASQPIELARLELLLNLEPLVFGNAHRMVVCDYIVVKGRPPLAPAEPSALYQRQASGGVAPLSYRSGDQAVARVDQEGRVQAIGNGSTLITVRDRCGSEASYRLDVQGVKPVTLLANCYWAVPISSPARQWEYQAISRAQMQILWKQYRAEQPGKSVPTILGWPNQTYWTCDNISTNGNAWAVDLNSLNPRFAGLSHPGGNRFPALLRNGW